MEITASGNRYFFHENPVFRYEEFVNWKVSQGVNSPRAVHKALLYYIKAERLLHQNQAHDYELKKQLATELQVKISAYQDKITSLEKTLEKADNKLQILRDDFSFVSHEKANLEGQIKQLQKIISIKQAENV